MLIPKRISRFLMGKSPSKSESVIETKRKTIV